MSQFIPQTYSLDDLATRANAMSTGQLKTPPVVVNRENVIIQKPQWGGLTWFIIFALVIGLLLFLFRPDMVLSTNAAGQKYLDWGKLVLWSLGLALVLIIILWLIKGASASGAAEGAFKTSIF